MLDLPLLCDDDCSDEKEKLEKAINLLKLLTRGQKISDDCLCTMCEVGKFLNEIV